MVTLITGGTDRHYVCALVKALASSGMTVDVVGSSDMSSCEMLGYDNVRLFTFYVTQPAGRSLWRKLISYIGVYVRLICYATSTSPHTLHILWDYKFAWFDRTLLLFYYKCLGHKIVFTAHNVNRAERDGSDSTWNRLTLGVQYRLVDHIFVHTKEMKDQLARNFGVSPDKVAVIPFGAGGMVPSSGMTSAEAKRRLGLRDSDKTILFFGRIAKYKGLDLLVDAFSRIALQDERYRLIIAGDSTTDWAHHWSEIRQAIESTSIKEQVIQEIRHIADEEMEIYFKAADVLALSYRQIFQSGVLFMAHSFGLPVIATDVGAFHENISEGINGYLCRPDDPDDLAGKIDTYFASELFENLDKRRASIQKLVQMNHSWDIVAKLTRDVYARVSQRTPLEDRALSTHFIRGPLRDQSDAAESVDS